MNTLRKPIHIHGSISIDSQRSSIELNKIKMITEFTLTYDYNTERNAKQIELPK